MDTSPTYTGTPLGGEPNSDTGRSSDEMARGKERISEELERGKARLADEAVPGKERLKEQGAQLVNRLEERGASMLEEQKQTICEEIHHYSAALRRAAESLHDDADERVATAADRMADELEAASEYLDQNRVSAIYRDAEEFARRRPEWVFGGLFLAGLAFGRFLKASSKNRLAEEPGADYESPNRNRERGRNLPASPNLYTPTPATAHAYGESGAAPYSDRDFGTEAYGGTESYSRPTGDTEDNR